MDDNNQLTDTAAPGSQMLEAIRRFLLTGSWPDDAAGLLQDNPLLQDVIRAADQVLYLARAAGVTASARSIKFMRGSFHVK